MPPAPVAPSPLPGPARPDEQGRAGARLPLRLLPRRARLLALAALACLVCLGLALYAVTPELPPLAETPGREWSRAVQVGVASLANPPGLAPLAGGRVALAWSAKQGSTTRILFSVVDPDGLAAPPRPLELAATFPQQPLLVADAAGGLHLAWIDGGYDRKQVLYAHLDERGRILGEPRQVSSPGVEVTMLAAAPTAAGGLALGWSNDGLDRPGAYLSLVDADGAIEPPRLLDSLGLAPAPALDNRGELHLAWLRVRPAGTQRLVYQAPHAGPLELADVDAVRAPRLRLALDRDHAYLLWHQARRGEAGVRNQVFLASTPLAAPAPAAARQVILERTSRVEFDDDSPAQGAGTDELLDPNVWPRQEEQAVALVTADQPRRGGAAPLFELKLAGGELVDVRQLSQARGLASAASAVRDDRGALHAAWLQGVDSDAHRLWQASTDPTTVALLGQRTRQDVREAGLQLGLTLLLSLTSTVLFPFRYAPALLLLGIGALSGLDEGRRGQLLLGAALLVQAGFNLLLGQLAAQTGFLDAALPQALVGPLFSQVIPLAAFLIGLVSLTVYGRMRPAAHPAVRFAAFALADGWATVLPFFALLVRGYLD